MLTEKSKKLYLKNIKSSISNIAKYIPGESDNKKNIKLSSNESPFLIPKKIRDIASKNVQTSNQYPDGDSLILKKSISKKFRISPDQIICGNGSDDILSLIGLAFTQENCEVICSQYSFLYYPIIAHSVGARVVFAKTKKLNISPKNIIEKINQNTKVIFIANPNNPTGLVLFKNELIEMLKKIPKDIIVVIDGAYAEFVLDKNFSDGLDLVKTFPNIIVTRTFSKVFAMAGFRIGWGYSSREIIETLEKIRGPFNVNTFAQVSASLILKDKRFLKKSISHNFKWRAWLIEQINGLGLKAFESFTNFILIKNKLQKISAKKIVLELKKKGVYVRDLDNYDLKNYFRISIGKENELRKLIKELKFIIKKYEKK